MAIQDKIKTFLSSIIKIEGPMRASILTPNSQYPNFPVILNLGDYHSDKDFCYHPSCQTTDGCLSLESFSFFYALSKFASENNLIVDFFLETWGYDKHLSFDKSAMTTIVNNFSELKNTFDKTIRFHFGDTRDDYDNKRRADAIIQSFLWCLSDYWKEQDLNYIKQWFERKVIIFPEFDRNQIIDSMIDILQFVSLEDYFKIPLIKKFSRTYHEFNKAPLEVQENLLRQQIDVYDVQDLLEYERIELINLLKEFKNGKTIKATNYPKLIDNKEIFINNKRDNNFLLDTYTICRILKKHAERKFAIIYSGNTHANKIENLLRPFYELKNVYREISPKCIEKEANEDTRWLADRVRGIYTSSSEANLRNPKYWFYTNSNGISFFEMLFSANLESNEQNKGNKTNLEHNKTIAKELVENLNNKILSEFRSSNNSSIFDLTIENNFAEVLDALFKRIRAPKGLIIKSLFHRANDCLRVLCEPKNYYNPIESVKISKTTVNSLVAAIYLNNEGAVKLLSSAINNRDIINKAVADAKNLLRGKKRAA